MADPANSCEKTWILLNLHEFPWISFNSTCVFDFQYGIMDTIQGESLASELEEAKRQGDITVDVYHSEPLLSDVVYGDTRPPRFDI